MKEPSSFRLLLNGLSGPSHQVPDHRFGQPLTGFAVTGRLGRDCGEPLVIAELLKPIDGVIAGGVVGEDLGEEEAEGDPRRIDLLSPHMIAATASGFDKVLRENSQEGKPLGLLESVSLRLELVARGWKCRLNHGGLLGVVTGVREQPPCYQTGRSPSSFPGTRDLNYYCI